MVLGLTRSRARLGGTGTGSLARPRLVDDGHRHWHAERGEILFEASCDVFGGFPGYAVRGGRLMGQRLRVTERYLLVGDGTGQGFGLAIDDIDGAALVPLPDGDESGLRLFYQVGISPRTFTVRFHGTRLSMRSGPRAERAHLSLLRAGHVERFGMTPPPEPDFVVSWDNTAEFDAEKVLWAGRATVPRHLGLDGVPGGVWLTTRSLIWGCAAMTGVHRVPLDAVTDVAAATLTDRAATPAVYVGLGDEPAGHFDLAFLFDQHSTPDHNLRERGAMLVGLRSRGVPVGSPTPPFQPWRHAAPPLVEASDDVIYPEPDAEEPAIEPWREDRADSPSPFRRRPLTVDLAGADPFYAAWPDVAVTPSGGSVAGGLSPARTSEDAPEQADALAEPVPRLLDIVLAEWSAPPDDRDRRRDDVQVAARWLSLAAPTADEPEVGSAAPTQAGEASDEAMPRPLSASATNELSADVANSVTDEVGPEPRDVATPAPQAEELDRSACWPRAAAYESTAVGALAEILAAIRDRADGRLTPIATSLPTAADQVASLAELTALREAGTVTADELRSRSARLLALGDACVRLRTLVELRDAGHLSDADLARRQQTITGQLAAVMEVR